MMIGQVTTTLHSFYPLKWKNVFKFSRNFMKRKANIRNFHGIIRWGLSHINFDQKHKLIVSTLQASVLLLLNDAERLSYDEIGDKLKLKDKDLFEILNSLSGENYKVLKKEPPGRISKTSVFEINSNFTTDEGLQEIKIPLSKVEREEDGPRVVMEGYPRDPQLVIDAALVRIMKKKTVLEDEQLVTDCVEELRQKFKPDRKTIRERIERMMGNYVKRDEENEHMLKYIP